MADSSTYNYNPSRLLTNSNNLRETLYTRNLYTPDVEYSLTNQNSANRVVDSISGIISAVAPFKSYNLKNTVYGRLITNPTPLTEIGLAMLGTQFAYNFSSNLAQQTFPTIKVSNLFDGAKNTKLFTPNINFSITRKEGDTDFENFLDRLFFRTVSTPHPSKGYPFTKNPNNADYIKNSGYGQLGFLYSAINQNIYKQNDSTLTEYGNIVDKPILPRNTITDNRTFFNFDSELQYPYLSNRPDGAVVNDADLNMMSSYKNSGGETQEYAPSTDYIDANFGKSNKTPDISREDLRSPNPNNWVDNNTEFTGDAIENKIIWGLNGTTDAVKNELGDLRPGVSSDALSSGAQANTFDGNFKVKAGLLEYTRNLLNATNGRFVDITRKAFTDGNKLTGLQGAGLWTANDSKYAQESGIAGKKGVRQHTILDQYDRFAKAIRFNGNIVYDGNENSVIYDSVLPRIHPTLPALENGITNNKNLMFSIENLAVGVISKGTYGIMDDEQGSPIPLSEVGPFNGRIMWFPPYNLEIVETAVAKWDSTVMIGRNEPMYNYMHSERNATVSFSLLMDYPEHLRNYISPDGKHKDISEFFAFGGDLLEAQVEEAEIDKIEIKIRDLDNDVKDIEGKPVTAEPEAKSYALTIRFPNDVPRVEDNLTTIIDTMYRNGYEIWDGLESDLINDTTAYGLNDEIYFISGITSTIVSGETKLILDKNVANAVSQYTAVSVNNQAPYGESLLNKRLKEIFENEDVRPLYSVYVYGAASKLYTELNPNDIEAGNKYNLALGKRRADATINLIKKKLETMFGKSVADGIDVIYDNERGSSIGDTQAEKENATKAAIPEEDTKNERVAYISIRRNSKDTPNKTVKLTPDEQEIIGKKKREIDFLYSKLNTIKSKIGDNVYNQRSKTESSEGDGAILGGFKSINGNYYYPIFHTQTPEDFHKRLTFLQQCTRQGAARRYSTSNVDGDLTARNSVFGRQPICILRIGDFFYTKIIIESINIDYNDTTWDMNPEGFGMQPMMANVTLNIKIMGGQSLKGPIDALQNACTYNYYANSNFTDKGRYQLPSGVADIQESFMKGVLNSKIEQLTKEDKIKNPDRYKES
jgi:hypothetical protein